MALRAVFSIGLLVCGFLLVERVTLYAFDPRRVDPADVGLAQLSEQVFETQGGRKMIYWIGRPRPDAPLVMYLHGNAGNLANRQKRLRGFVKRGYGIVAPAYPGSSGSEGWPSQSAITADIAEFYADLTDGSLTGQRERPAIYGESIGAAVAIQVLAEAEVSPRAVVLEAPFTSIRDVARDLNPWLQGPAMFLTSPWDSLQAAPALVAPLLVLHGREDKLIPPAHGREIHDAAASTDKTYLPVEGAGHVNVWTVTAQRQLFRWLEARLR